MVSEGKGRNIGLRGWCIRERKKYRLKGVVSEGKGRNIGLREWCLRGKEEI